MDSEDMKMGVGERDRAAFVRLRRAQRDRSDESGGGKEGLASGMAGEGTGRWPMANKARQAGSYMFTYVRLCSDMFGYVRLIGKKVRELSGELRTHGDGVEEEAGSI